MFQYAGKNGFRADGAGLGDDEGRDTGGAGNAVGRGKAIEPAGQEAGGKTVACSRRIDRALYRGDADRYANLLAEWPRDVRSYVLRLAAPAFASGEAATNAQSDSGATLT